MKHVFLIHSNTVLLSALGAIVYEKLNYDDVIFLFSRNFKSTFVNKGILVKDITAIIDIASSKGFNYNFFKQRKFIKTIDRFLEKEVKDIFVMYVPHAAAPFCVFLTNKNRLYSCLLQEGAYSFFNNPTMNAKIHLKNFLFSNNRLWWTSSWDIPSQKKKIVNLKKTYAIDNSYFKALSESENIIINWPSVKDNRFLYPEKTCFFIFDTAIEEGFASTDNYLFCCRRLISESGVKKCFLKFHPAQRTENIDKINALFEGVDAELVDNTIPFEIILTSSRNLNLYGFSTSLLRFGSMLGHHVTSYMELLRGVSTKKYHDHLKKGGY